MFKKHTLQELRYKQKNTFPQQTSWRQENPNIEIRNNQIQDTSKQTQNKTHKKKKKNQGKRQAKNGMGVNTQDKKMRLGCVTCDGP
jgi:hypothetical protein